ncbi:MAG: GxxExxY protein [Pirellulaceae bacterium]
MEVHENEIGTIVVDSGFQVHSSLGPGLLESVYEMSLAYELESRGLHVVRQQPIEVKYRDTVFDEGFRADLVVENKVIIELKSVEEIHPVHKKQLLTYLKLSDCRLGYLINFGAPLFTEGITRVVNKMDRDLAMKPTNKNLL